MLVKNVAKSIILNTDNKVLLLVRSAKDDHAPGRLDLPGGGIEDGEDFATGVAREVMEESGIKINPSEFQLLYAATSFNEDKTYNKMAFMARTESTNVVLSKEHTSYQWVDLDQAIKKFDHPVYGRAMRIVQDKQLHKI